jgi:hypothetical protein
MWSRKLPEPWAPWSLGGFCFLVSLFLGGLAFAGAFDWVFS